MNNNRVNPMFVARLLAFIWILFVCGVWVAVSGEFTRHYFSGFVFFLFWLGGVLSQTLMLYVAIRLGTKLCGDE